MDNRNILNDKMLEPVNGGMIPGLEDICGPDPEPLQTKLRQTNDGMIEPDPHWEVVT